MNKHSRPYDVAMSDDYRAAVQKRRDNPTGVELEVKRVRRRGQLISIYPFKNMLLGDFFYVPVPEHLTRDSFVIRFRQAAARHNMELTIVDWKIGKDKQRGLRVAYTCGDIAALKKKAQQKVRGIRISDGKWLEARRTRDKQRRAEAKRTKAPPYARHLGPRQKPIPVAQAPEDDAPLAFELAIAEKTETDATEGPGYDRAAVLAARLAALREDQ